MKHLVTIIIILLASSSCVKNKEQNEIIPYTFGKNDIEKISGECSLIAEAGNIFELLRLIKIDTHKVLTLVEGEHFPGIEDKVEGIASAIRKNSSKVIELTKAEWNSPDIRYHIGWHLNENEFGSKNQYLYNAQVRQVYFQGKERPDLINKVTISQTGNDFTVNYLTASSLLEYCQLNETLMVAIEIKSKTFLRTRSLFFNLHVNLEK